MDLSAKNGHSKNSCFKTHHHALAARTGFLSETMDATDGSISIAS